jgi:hypothetical protein
MIRKGQVPTQQSIHETGLHPFNPRCDGWEQGINTFGFRDQMTTDKQQQTNYEVRVKPDASKSSLTDKERQELQGDGFGVSTRNCLEIGSLRANMENLDKHRVRWN